MSVALLSLYVFAATIAFGFGLVFTGHWKEGEDLFLVVFPAVTAFTGFACGVEMSK